MRIVISLLGGLLALGWGRIAVDYADGARQSTTLERVPPYEDDAPSLSVVVAACNEEEKLPHAFRTLLTQDYPGPLEIMVVDDRSTDGTPQLVDALSREAVNAGKRALALHVRYLPSGWLGKTHALYQGAKQATGRWILFTDADVQFTRDALSRAVRYAEERERHHLVAFFGMDLRGFWEHVFGLGFSFLFFMRFRPWRVHNPKTAEYLGVGGFNLVRRDAYEAIGGHRAIALEVADDMELGRRLKHAGYGSEVIGAADAISVRWQEGLSGLMNGLNKNAYAGLDYSLLVLIRSVALLLFAMILPFLGLLIARHKAGRIGYGIASLLIVCLGGWHAETGNIPFVYGLTLPVSTLLLIAVMIRSAWTTERNGGITWRGTFYPLAELRARAIPPPPLLLVPKWSDETN